MENGRGEWKNTGGKDGDKGKGRSQGERNETRGAKIWKVMRRESILT